MCSAALAATALAVAPTVANAETIEERAVRSVVTILAGPTQGSGFAYSRRGEILTNAHVVEGSSTVTVVLPDERRVEGRITAIEDDRDLAVVQAPIDLVPLAPRRERARVGESVFAIGSPIGLEGSVTKGTLSAIRAGSPGGATLQTDLTINPGNSGGPLCDARGRVLGVNTSIAAQATGIAFAVPLGGSVAAPAGVPVPDRRPGVKRGEEGGGGWSLAVALAALLLVVGGAGVAAAALRRRAAVPVTLRNAQDRTGPEPEVRLHSDEPPVVLKGSEPDR